MDWNTLRNEFPVTRHWAFLDHAAVAPLSGRAHSALVAWADDLAANGVVNESGWVKRIEVIRQQFAKLLNAEAEEVAFVKNTSEGIGFVAEGYPWKHGDNVVIAEEEYPANVYPWMNLASRGVEVRRIKSRGARIEFDDLVAALDSHTRLVSLSFVEFASGFRNDLDRIGALCRERGIHFCVDAIQGLGVFPMDVKRSNIDFLAADGHKWLLGPEGAGVFYIRRELIERLRPVSVGWNSVVGAWDFSKIDFRLKAHAGRWENGTLNMGGIVALGASVDQLLELGVENIAARLLDLTDHLCERATSRGLEVFSSRREEDRSGIVSLIVPNLEAKEAAKACRAAKIVVSARAGRVRVSPHMYNTKEELDSLLDLLVDLSGKTP